LAARLPITFRTTQNSSKEGFVRKGLFFTIGAALLLSAAIAFGTSEQSIQVGKTGYITLGHDTKIGDLVLKAAQYTIQFEPASGTGHVLAFQLLGDPDLALQYSDLAQVGTPVGVRCQLEKLAAPAKHTRVTITRDGNERRITRVEIKEENVAHVF
jgi:hypothetical protein